MNTKELNKEKGQRLKACILDKYRSQKDFAELVTSKGFYNLTPQNLNAMIKGSRTISREFAHTIAGLLEVNERYLLCETDDPYMFDESVLKEFNHSHVLSTREIEVSTIVKSIINILEIKYHTPLYFYVLPKYIKPQEIHLCDLISKYKKEISPEFQNDDYRVLDHILKNASPFPADRIEICKCIDTFNIAEKKEKAEIKYRDWNSVRRKCTRESIELLDDSAYCNISCNDGKHEVFIECIEIKGKIITFCDFEVLISICINTIKSLFDHSDDIKGVLENELEDFLMLFHDNNLS
jgi:transcriptional regulator with XRE-family HTH domain